MAETAFSDPKLYYVPREVGNAVNLRHLFKRNGAKCAISTCDIKRESICRKWSGAISAAYSTLIQ